jgi:hypothetical protein
LIDQYLQARFAPTRIVKVIEEDTSRGNDELCPLFSRFEGRIDEALVFIEALREIRRSNEISPRRPCADTAAPSAGGIAEAPDVTALPLCARASTSAPLVAIVAAIAAPLACAATSSAASRLPVRMGPASFHIQHPSEYRPFLSL